MVGCVQQRLIQRMHLHVPDPWSFRLDTFKTLDQVAMLFSSYLDTWTLRLKHKKSKIQTGTSNLYLWYPSPKQTQHGSIIRDHQYKGMDIFIPHVYTKVRYTVPFYYFILWQWNCTISCKKCPCTNTAFPAMYTVHFILYTLYTCLYLLCTLYNCISFSQLPV